VQDEVNQEESKQEKVNGMKKGADSTRFIPKRVVGDL